MNLLLMEELTAYLSPKRQMPPHRPFARGAEKLSVYPTTSSAEWTIMTLPHCSVRDYREGCRNGNCWIGKGPRR